MTDTVDHERDLSAVLLELAGWIPSQSEPATYLDTVLQRSCAAIDAAAGAVLLQSDTRTLEPVTATDERVRWVESLEADNQEGPCVDAYRAGQRTIHQDVGASASNWPRFTRAVLELGFGSAFAFPLLWHDQTIGTLKLFRERPGPVRREHLRCVQSLAQMATVGILQQRAVHDARREADQLQTALHSRVAIEQAKGILAEHGDLSMDDAFQALRAYSRNHNLTLHATARAVTAGELRCSDLVTTGCGQASAPIEAQPAVAVHAPHQRVRVAILHDNRVIRRAAGDARRAAMQLRSSAVDLRDRAHSLSCRLSGNAGG